MLILTIKTDQPETEIGLCDNNQKIEIVKWQAHRHLSTTIHQKIEALLKKHKKDWNDIAGIVSFKGPGSFTGLRIGLSVANALAYGLEVPIIGAMGESWQKGGIDKLLDGKNEKVIMPEYGSEPHITQPKK